ncbi:MAG: glycosyltransferase [Desulfovibrionales bacterium]
MRENRSFLSGRPPRISVLLPVYNAETTLIPALESLFQQSYPHFEIIAVDDGSTDRSGMILQRLSLLDPRLRVISRPHRGIVSALNTAISLSRAPLLARMDADDIALPGRLKVQKELLQVHPETGLVASKVGYLGKRRKNQGYARYVDWTNTLISHKKISINRFVESPLAHPTVMFRKNLVERFGPYREGPFPEDYELWLRLLENGVRMQKIPRTLLFWRDSSGRLSRTHSNYSPEAFSRVKAEYLSQWLTHNNPHHPRVILWGSGRITRKRAGFLLQAGIEFSAYVDIDLNKIGHTIQGVPVLSPDQIPPPGKAFILSFVSKRGAREEIGWMLDCLGYRIGVDYVFGA